MKKVLCTIALMLLIGTSAYAQATFSLTGSYWAEGKYWFNYNSTPDVDANYSERSYGFYEQDINLFPKITVGNTSLNMKVAITDTWWGAELDDTDTNETGIFDSAGDDTALDDNIAIERAFVSHKISDKLTVDVGLMDGTAWGTSFADDTTAQWRVKFVGQTPVGVVGAVLEKNNELGAGDDSLEGEDRDSYGLFAITKAGSVYIKPLLWYVHADDIYWGSALEGAAAGSGSLFTIFNPVLALNGDLGAVSFEAEINYKMYGLEVDAPAVGLDFDEDWETLGLYLNVWKALDAMTPGFIVAYGSYNDDIVDDFTNTTLPAAFASFEYFAGFDFEDDFNSTVILGDEYGWGGGDDIRAATFFKLYVNDIKTGIDPLTLSAYAAYAMSNLEDNAFRSGYEDATVWELGLGTAYKFTDNFVYSIYGAYADISYDTAGIDDPDSVYILANAVEFTF